MESKKCLFELQDWATYEMDDTGALKKKDLLFFNKCIQIQKKVEMVLDDQEMELNLTKAPQYLDKMVEWLDLLTQGVVGGCYDSRELDILVSRFIRLLSKLEKHGVVLQTPVLH